MVTMYMYCIILLIDEEVFDLFMKWKYATVIIWDDSSSSFYKNLV